MLVDDSISRGGTVLASTAPGEKGGEISLLDLPMERDGRELLACFNSPATLRVKTSATVVDSIVHACNCFLCA